MKTTVIISVYKDTESLALILKSLKNQSIKASEIIVSEDGNSEEMKSFLKDYPTVKHVFQEDQGWQKNKALNNALRHSEGEYLIFLDGDVIPYHHFIKEHINASESKKVLMGKRIELGKYISILLRKKYLSSYIL